MQSGRGSGLCDFQEKSRKGVVKNFGAPRVGFWVYLGRPFRSIFGPQFLQERKNRDFWRHPRRDGMEDCFRSRFWTNFERFSGMKNEQKCGRVCLFLSFVVFKMSADLDSNLEASWAWFWEVFGR